MNNNRSVEFFVRQFERQIRQPESLLNPFEQAALPPLRGNVLDFGCGMGNFAMAAARADCSVLALDASDVAVSHLRQVASAEGQPVEAQVADPGQYDMTGHFGSIVSIGLLTFLDCAAAQRALVISTNGSRCILLQTSRGSPAAERHGLCFALVSVHSTDSLL